ncbi:MAG TPA: HAMP domain-containing sensor histidine kinase [Acidimicrobiales bacterium]|nr:HAMP domain-containing sensor histidine kinase [Acidimicrobiales bacterium]
MRRRFTLAIVGVAAGALLIAGLGTLLLLNLQARRQARSDVSGIATRIADDYAHRSPANPLPALRSLQDLLKTTQRLGLVLVADDGRVTGAMPGGLTPGDINPTGLAEGHVVSGFRGNVAFAVAPFLTPGTTQELGVVVTQRAAGYGGPVVYFLLAGAVVLVVAFGVAEGLARRITHPLIDVQQAADRIARGDLTARVPGQTGSYPELSSLASSINAMADNLERLRGQERQFLLSVSHDLRTPLTSIRGFAEALGDGTTTDTRKAAEVIAAEARRLERLVRDLLDLAKLDARAFSLNVRPTDLAEVVRETAEGFTPTAEGLGLRVVVHPPACEQGASAEPVAADPDRLAQVVANLVENACKYASSAIEVGTWYRQGPDGVEGVLTIDDDGPGVAPEELPRMFERLWTSTRAQARQVGSGLGLAIVAELVAAMGGTIRAQSPVPRWTEGDHPGTRLVVTLKAMGPGQAPPPPRPSLRRSAVGAATPSA